MTNMAAPQIETVTDEAMGVIASAARINAWAEVAKAGDEFVYASRCFLMPASAEGARAARMLYSQGLATLKQRRVGGLTNYVLERSSRPWNAPKAVTRVAIGPTVTSEAATIDALYRVLLRQARFGRPCPTDAKLAALATVSIASVQPALAAMVETGLIRIKRVKAPTLRIIAILATNQATGMIA